ncbi:hypothetical protein IP360_04800 [Helicobacter winghamensis]|uniref:Uncharacterized protein n=2 Tax=Helicobacter winghamensis TaxID=157268 RepID=A0A2N3PKI8_9HELI|nr:hypothetical protein HWAG_00757 [Helicobacter winghamensis ATCC BAA-430]PKT76978.1 hypothetical protein BCM34_07320 [Helicobacter winghamensis]PKT77118.1 hypothetical protein BCM35_03405 [Helicobacter winghamensis]PKT77679.1 hypothetical protein BCM32_05680 [Helicobacter winghamensis]PKT81917.1 hypothetical protein BCM31_01675 [Helicobacter winghamensis]
MNWLNELKVAYLNKNDNKMSELLDNLPTLKTRDEMFEALAIMEQITEYAKAQKERLGDEMRKLKQTKNFLPKEEKISRLNLSF